VGRLGKNVALVAGCAAFAMTREPAGNPGVVFLIGLALASAAEYVYHRFVLHGKFHGLLRREHVAHHRAFPKGERIDRSDPRVVHLVEHPAVFPLAFFAIYAGLALAGAAYRELLLALALHYVLFEAAHWGTHVRDNTMDRILLKLPVFGGIRARMIEHHLSHHGRPDADFSVLPPYGPDFLLGTKR
jgi:hypothetical protein